MKAFICAVVAGPRSMALSSSTALQARPWGVQPANCIENDAAAEVTATKTASSSLRLVCTLAPAAASRSMNDCGLVASNGPAGAAGFGAGLGAGVAVLPGAAFEVGALAGASRQTGHRGGQDQEGAEHHVEALASLRPGREHGGCASVRFP